VTAIAMGSLHTCALTSEGGVKCWGAGTVIGNGSTTDSPVPVDVVGLTSGVAAIAAGDQYTCALTTAGAVRCWGYLQGPSSAIPTDIPGLETGVTSIDVSPRTLCAVLETGAARCTDNPTVAPREAPGLEGGIRKVVVGAGAGGPGEVHLCIITTDSDVRCAGRNAVGQLGDGSTTDRQAFVDVVSSSAPGPGSSMPPASAAASAVSMGSIFACAVTSGAAKCWGSNSGGLLGNGSTTDSLLPVDVFGLGSGVSSVDAGFRHACALTTAGGVKCWGSNSFGQLGTGSNADSLIPVNVAGLASGVRAIAAGTFETCALTNAGGVRCWGSINDANAPVDVPGLTSGVSAISVGGSHSCALTTGGVVKCWDSARPAPTDVAGLDNVTAIAAGDRHACAIARDGAAKCWGLLNNSGQLGNGSTAASPSAVDVVGLGGGVTAIAAGVGHSCALTTGGAVKCWGSGDSGELGNGAKIDSHVPVDVAAVSGATGIVAGDGSTCALVIGGDIYCWGANNYGQLGNGLKAASSTPVRVSGL
jgi:alpha-tubulin suppressor-like RCC1 family protein